MKEYSCRIKIENADMPKPLYKKYRNKIADMVKDCASCLDFDLNVKVVARKRKMFDKNTYYGGSVERGGKGYKLYLYEDALKSVKYDGGFELDKTLYHEFLHIYDMEHVRRNDYCSLAPFRKSKSYGDFFVKTGYKFWTEFFARFRCHIQYKENVEDCATFYQLIKRYKEISQKYEAVYDSEKLPSKKYLDDIYSELESFVYLFSVYVARDIFRRRENYCYSVRLRKSSYYKLLSKAYNKIIQTVISQLYCPYGKLAESRLCKIGEIIFEQFYYPLGLRLGYSNKSVCVFM